jgi:2-polyprenyl-3-methyl-5-hydroxy-6-metoxy-1,4-benzoquinol methylase
LISYNGFFDYIVLFQVLEHIDKFENLLQNIHYLLKNNGKLIISVPNGESVLIQEKYFPGIDMLPNHVNKWNEKSLKIALNKFEDIKIFKEKISYINELKSILYGYIKLKSSKDKSIHSFIYATSNKILKYILMFTFCVPAIPRAILTISKIKNPNLIAVSKKTKL